MFAIRHLVFIRLYVSSTSGVSHVADMLTWPVTRNHAKHTSAAAAPYHFPLSVTQALPFPGWRSSPHCRTELMRVEDSCVDHEAALLASCHALIVQVALALALALATGVCGHQLGYSGLHYFIYRARRCLARGLKALMLYLSLVLATCQYLSPSGER